MKEKNTEKRTEKKLFSFDLLAAEKAGGQNWETDGDKLSYYL